MASPFRPTGVYVPLVTPFDDAAIASISARSARLADHVLASGAKGIVALATTGEPTSLDDAERAGGRRRLRRKPARATARR